MGRIIVEQITSADGFAADADGGMSFMQFAERGFEDDTDQVELLRNVDAIVLARTTYAMFAEYWPTADPAVEPVAEPINRLPKHVISTSLERAPWGEGELPVERGDGVESVRRLAQRYERDLIVWGSLRLTDDLFRAGAVDVLRLRIVPGLIGSGRGVTPADLTPTALEFEKSVEHPGGELTVQYRVLR